MFVYLEGELKEKFQTPFKKHLDNCSDCQRELKSLADTQSYLRQILKLKAKEAVLPIGAEKRIRQRLLCQIRPSLPSKGPVLKKFFGKKVFALAAIFSVLALVLFFTHYPQPSLEAKTVNLAAKSPRVQEILAHGIMKAGGISITGKNQGLFFLMVEKREDFQETQVFVHVDLVKKQVVKIEENTGPPLTEAEKAEALAIAQSKPEVQALLNQGYTPKKVIPAFPPLREFMGKTKGVFQLPLDKFARVILEDKENKKDIWLVRVNLLTRETIEITPEIQTKEAPKERETKIRWDEERGILKWEGQEDEGRSSFEIKYGKNSGKKINSSEPFWFSLPIYF